MPSATSVYLATSIFLDADIIYRLWKFQKSDGLSFKKFSKRVRKAEGEDLDHFLLPFIRSLPAIDDGESRKAERTKSKAALLLLTKPDLRLIWTNLVKNDQEFRDFRRFIQRGPPDSVLQTIKEAAESDELCQLSPRLQALIRNRAVDLKTISEKDHDSVLKDRLKCDTNNVQATLAVDLGPIQNLLAHVDKSKQAEMVAIYQEGIENGKSQRKAIKAALRAVDKVKQKMEMPQPFRPTCPSPTDVNMHPKKASKDKKYDADAGVSVNDKMKNRELSMQKQHPQAENPGNALTALDSRKSMLLFDGKSCKYAFPESSQNLTSISPKKVAKEEWRARSEPAPLEYLSKKCKRDKYMPGPMFEKKYDGHENDLLMESVPWNQTAAPASRSEFNSETENNTPMQLYKQESKADVLNKKTGRAVYRFDSENDLLRESLKSTDRPKEQLFYTKNQFHDSSLLGRTKPSRSCTANGQALDETPHKKRRRETKARQIPQYCKIAAQTDILFGPSNSETQRDASMTTQRLIDQLLSECFVKTASKQESQSGASKKDVSRSKAKDVSKLATDERSNLTSPSKILSPEPRGTVFSQPTSRGRKRRRLTPIEALESHSKTLGMLEVDKIDEDVERSHLGVNKRRRKSSSRKASDENTMSQGFEGLTDAQLAENAGNGLLEITPNTSSKYFLGRPMNCLVM
ncbi:uncharacterized protein PV09_07204 [Verruconis gallopava]|uniref:Uncharacterized protein n=1 Tax=Verruconis gallopava TaxID=253628 RepID=A0A0D1XGW2_9PEZI|nr:uncharacterized protein PV09_07204 [Verruconis gallopava]KIW01446.1 hypothetical protein PV09_07204 [Verruconis gallopava]